MKARSGGFVGRRMGMQPAQEELPVFVPQGGGEFPVPQEGQALIPFDAFDEETPRAVDGLIAEAEVLVEPEANMASRGDEIEEHAFRIGDGEFPLVEGEALLELDFELRQRL